jgi:AraC-like DNA-binding protein
MYVIEINKSFSLSPETSDNHIIEVVLVSAGHLVLESNFNIIRVNSRDIHLSFSHDTNSVNEVSDDSAGWYLRLDVSSIKDHFLQEKIENETAVISSFLYRYPLYLTPSLFHRLSAVFARLFELSKTSFADDSLVYAYFLVGIYEIKKLMKESVLDFYPTKAFTIVQKYSNLLYRHVEEKHRISFYANQLGITPNHLNKSVKTVLGKTAGRLLNERRLMEAKSKLKYTNLSISEIAMLLGFEDQSYFSRFFKRETNKTPLDFRKLNQS